MERKGLYVTGVQNETNLRTACDDKEVDEFMHADDTYIPVMSCNADDLEQQALMEVSTDTDGIVVEVSVFKAAILTFRRLHVHVERNRINSYHHLKKHLDLPSYSFEALPKAKLTCFKESRN